MTALARGYYEDLRSALEAGPPPELDRAAVLLYDAAAAGRSIYTFGNGASAALASHLATDLGKGTAHDHGLPPAEPAGVRVRLSSLSDNAALVTAYGNDVGYEFTFVEQLRGLMREGDVV